MEKSAQTIKKFVANLVRYLVYFVCVVVTPILTKPIAPFFDWVGYGQMRDMFARVFTCIFWALELIMILLVELNIKANEEQSIREGLNVERSIRKGLKCGETLDATLDESFRAWTKAKENEHKLPQKTQKGKKMRRVKQPPLPLWNVVLLTLISVGCILLISIQTEFQVKPIYDIGEKVTGHQLYSKIALWVCNIIKCVWIVFFLHAAFGMAEVLTRSYQGKSWLTWLVCGVMLMIFGTLDAFCNMAPFSWTYLLFYATFTLVYYLTKRNGGKTFGLVLLIYMF